jgi:AcrR family transcriptional regulator
VTETPSLTRLQTTERTRATVLSAAVTLFVARGFEAVSLRDIAAEAGLSHTAVNRHFPTKKSLFEACVDDLAARATHTLPDLDGSLHDVVRVARANEAVPGYVALTTGLLGAAIALDHPAHEGYRTRYAETHSHLVSRLQSGMSGQNCEDQATRLIAVWDGLQTISLYLPGVIRVSDVLASRLDEALLRSPVLPPSALLSPSSTLPLAVRDPADGGYTAGRVRRENIIDGAMAVFAKSGFYGSSLRDAADLIGVSKSTMLHHFPTKADLLAAVLAERDRRVQLIDNSSLPALERLRSTAEGSREHQETEPGLIKLYAVLSTEATAAEHPAHAYFAERYAAVVNVISRIMAGVVGEEDAAVEAVWFIALWEGLQYQWLLDPRIDVASHLDAYIDTLVVPATVTSGPRL